MYVRLNKTSFQNAIVTSDFSLLNRQISTSPLLLAQKP